MYSENVISCKQVSEWCRKFKEERTSLIDEERPRTPQTVCNTETEHRVKEFLVNDQRSKLKVIVYILDLTKTFVYRILHDGFSRLLQ